MPIAIDFGTERTKLAYPGAHGPELMMLGAGGMAHIPTLFYIGGDGNRLYGDDAAERLEDDPGGVITTLKRKIHEPRLRVNRQKIQPIELVASLLRQLRERAEREVPAFAGQRLDEVILTMPAQYGPSDRELMRGACLGAGFTEIGFIPEPVAAARAWTLTPGGKTDVVVVFDCGGGTIDWACLRRQRDGYALVADFPPGGSIRVGGHDVDRDILDFVMESVDEETRGAMEDREAFYLAQARRAKERYCNNGVLSPFRAEGRSVEIAPEQMDLLLRGRFVEQSTLDVAKYVQDVKDGLKADVTILMVGGSSRLKGLEEALRERTGCPIARWDKSDYAIVLGALAPERKEGTAQTVNLPATPVALREPIDPPPPSSTTAPSVRTDDDDIPFAEEAASRSVLGRVLRSPPPAMIPGLHDSLRQRILDLRTHIPFFEHSARLAWRISDPYQLLATALKDMLSAETPEALVPAVTALLHYTTPRHFPEFTDYSLDTTEKYFASLRPLFVDTLTDLEKYGLPFDTAALASRVAEEGPAFKKRFLSLLRKTKPLHDAAFSFWSGMGVSTFVPFEIQLLGRISTGAAVSQFLAGAVGGFFGGAVGGSAAAKTLGWIQGKKSQVEMTAMITVMQGALDRFVAFLEQVEQTFRHAYADIEPAWCDYLNGIVEEALRQGVDQNKLAEALGPSPDEKIDRQAAQIVNLVLDSMDADEDMDEEIKAATYEALRRSGEIPKGKKRLNPDQCPEAEGNAREKRVADILAELAGRGFEWLLTPNIPQDKAVNAMRGYARGVVLDEILAMHDATIFGGGNKGYLILEKGIWVADELLPRGQGYFPKTEERKDGLRVPPGRLIPWHAVSDVDAHGAVIVLTWAGNGGNKVEMSLPCGNEAKMGKATLSLLEELVGLLKA